MADGVRATSSQIGEGRIMPEGYEIVFPTESETSDNLRPCAHGDPCESCFVSRSMDTIRAKCRHANGGKRMPRWIAEKLRETCRMGYRAEESWHQWIYNHRN